jgi:putative glutamine amidotransferase
MNNKLKVGVVTSAFFEHFKSVYSNAEIIGAESSRVEYDLVIFTGGNDINPARYGKHPDGTYGFSDERDDLELRVLSLIFEGEIRANKVLGVCRGLQMLNVGFGGSLIQDMRHPSAHELVVTVKNPLSPITYVNSLHHQAVDSIGSCHIGGNNHAGIVLAKEPNSDIIETVIWGNKFLGVQYHPEFFGDKRKDEFFSIVDEWVVDKVSFPHRPARNVEKAAPTKWKNTIGNYPISYTVTTGTTTNLPTDTDQF